MASRIRIGGRVLGSGKYGTDVRCLCGEIVQVLGRCLQCHDALRRRRLGLAPNTAAEGKRLAGYMEKFEAASSRCKGCGATLEEDHHAACAYREE